MRRKMCACAAAQRGGGQCLGLAGSAQCGAEGSSGWGGHEGAGLGGICKESLTSGDALLRGSADIEVWAIKLGDTLGTLGHHWNPSPQFPCVHLLELTTHFAASMELKTTDALLTVVEARSLNSRCRQGWFPLEAPRESLTQTSSWHWGLLRPGQSWLVDASLPSPPPSSHDVLLCMSSPLVRTAVLGREPTLNPGGLIWRSLPSYTHKDLISQ